MRPLHGAPKPLVLTGFFVNWLTCLTGLLRSQAGLESRVPTIVWKAAMPRVPCLLEMSDGSRLTLRRAAEREFIDNKTSMITDEDPLRGLLFT